MSAERWPKLHNATWPGVVGKGPDSDEPFLSLEKMLDLTAAAEVAGQRFDGVDLFLCAPHVDIDSSSADLDALCEQLRSRNLVAGSLVAPVWPPTGGGSAMGSEEERNQFLTQVRKSCAIGKELRQRGVRPYGIVRIDSAGDPGTWSQDPEGNTQLLVDTFRRACDIAEEFGERLAAEGEVCWGGMHSWRKMLDVLEGVGRPGTLGFQADMAHTLLYLLGTNAPEDAILPAGFGFDDDAVLTDAWRKLTAALRDWTVDLHIAQNDGTVKGQGSHDKTGRHCLPNDPNGKLDIVREAGHWMRDDQDRPTRAFAHLCWDGCMFPNPVMEDPATWNRVLETMIAVREAHGWTAAAERA